MSSTAARPAGAGTQGAARRLLWWMVVPVLALLAVLTLLQYRQRLADSERELLRRADERAQELEAIARPAMAHVQDLRRLLELNWDAPPDAGSGLRQALSPRPLPPPAAPGAVDGWSLDAAPEAVRAQHGQVWWAPPDARPPDALWLRRAELFLRAARVVHERAPGFEATWFVAGDENLNFGYPWVDTGRMLASMGLPTLQAVDKPRAESVERSKAELARDPKDISFWGVPYVSQLDGELVQSHGMVVQVAGRYVGEVSLDFRLDALQRIARAWQEPGTRVWVADSALRLLADATEPLRPPVGPGLADTQVAVPLASRLPWAPSADELATLKAPQGSRAALLRGGDWVVVTAGRPGSPWLYVQAVPLQTLRAQVLPTLLPNALLGLALLLVFVAGQWLFARWFVTPALRVLGYLRARSTDPQAAVPQLGGRWQDWVDAVTDTFETQRLLQQRERATEAFKSAMVDHAPLAIVTSDGQGRIVDFNPAAEMLFGVPRADALGQELDALILPDAARGLHGGSARRLTSGVHTARHRQGREFPMQMLSFRVQIDGEPFDTAFISDLSAQQDAAAQIDRQREALRQSEKLSAMGTLLAGVAHELNNPLAIVMGRASLLEEKADGGPAQDDARRIREAAERCGRIVRTFLNMARQKPPSRSAVQINDTVRAAADMLGYTLRSHGIQVNLQLADAMPDVQADPDQLGQVVLNLMVNAQQAMESLPGPRVLSLSTGVEASRPGAAGREPRVWLRVADTGPGVPAAARERLFEPFFTTKAAGFGTGLGLSVSRSIVREHGGDLVLEPRDGGAVFRMSLPISGGAAPTRQPVPLDPATAEGHHRVLVVDDEAEIADLMRAVLEGAGFDVATAESGAVALEMLAEARFDAIVSDVRMPDIDGAALWRAVREQHPLLAGRMLFVSGDTLSSQARQVLEETRCPSLDKPFARGDLLAAVRRLVDR
ncbi:ATP-binding response regulator [Pseudorhodoferax sp.]|uniref:ATP-binding response regulator n=1 Tax=Pseudorhodoferax sp. TaxID=1993553 RepID=UPI002DD690DF|nr:ATP-binding protein [Pseudorhodoferax sp.]